MHPLVRIIMEFLHPINMFNNRIRVPIVTFLRGLILQYRKRTLSGINNAKDVLFRVGILSLCMSIIVWISIFMYVVFYYTYMPNITHSKQVHLQFKSCDEQPGLCSFPTAHIQLTKRQNLLMVGQRYRIKLSMDMPETEVNRQLGMFMVCTQMTTRSGNLVGSSCRSVMLKHRSTLHKALRTIVISPFLIFGVQEEKQTLMVELFDEFEDDQSQPVTDAYIELQSRHAQVYSASLYIEAHFTGLRYIMFNWPIISASFGISSNLLFVTLICALSWYHLQEGLPPLSDKLQTVIGFKKESEDTSEDIKIEDDSPSYDDQSYLNDINDENIQQ